VGQRRRMSLDRYDNARPLHDKLDVTLVVPLRVARE
jgi:hypothetical protein